MKKNSIIFSLLCTLLAFAGCQYDNQEYADRIAEATDLPVILKAGNDDGCLNLQLERLAEEFDKLPRASKARLLKTLKENYDSIELRPTRVVQKLFEESAELSLYYQWCYENGCSNQAEKSKRLESRLIKIGPDPVTRVGKPRHLTLTAEAALDASVRKSYWTSSDRVYREVCVYESPEFNRYRASGELWLDREESYERRLCGETVGLSSLLRTM